jgi:hypothetical protein
MAREIPEVVRAVAGLAATVLDEARKLPETLPGLPVRLIGQALQTSLKLQQQYSGLVARGDELFTGLRGEDEPGLATFDDDLPAAPRTTGPRSSAFDRVGDLPSDPAAEELAVADLPLADRDELSEEAAAVLLISTEEDTEDLSPAVVAGLPDDPIADAVTAVVDELAAEVVDEVVAELPDAVPDEVLEDLTADTVAEVAEEEEAVQEAVAEELIAEAAVGGAPPTEDAPRVPALADITPDGAPEQTQLVDDGAPDVAALEVAAEEIVDLGGPEAADSVTPEVGPDDGPAGGSDVSGSQAAGTSPVEGYDSFSIPALRGHLRAYPAETVADLLDYERATRARAPYVTLLQNRLEKLSADRG